MRKDYKLLIPILCSCFLFSCVSAEKYKELTQVKEYLEQENQRLTSLEEENRNLRADNRKGNLEIDKLQAQLVDLESSFNSLNRNYQDLANRYNNLIANNRHIGSGSAADKQYWEEELAKKQLELENQQREIQTIRYTVQQKEKRVQELLQLLRAKN